MDCYGSDFNLCLFIFSTGNGKAPCFSKETLHIMWEKCQEECQFNFICSSTSLFAHKIKHKIKKLLPFNDRGLVQSVCKSEFLLLYGS